VPQKETTPFYPRSPYGVAKLYAYWITVNYREAYGIYACNGILFNHESARRGETFVTRKITRALADIAMGLDECLFLGNLNARRDWGHAKDYVEMQWRMLQQDEPKDYVIATGHQLSVREFIEASARQLGVSLRWEGEAENEIGIVEDVDAARDLQFRQGDCVVRIDPAYYRPAEVENLLGDPSRAHAELGWQPTTTLDEMVEEMIAHDLDQARQRALLKESGCDFVTTERSEADLKDSSAVARLLEKLKPESVIVAAARVGGIHANNTYPADFIYDNLMIEANLIHGAYQAGCERLLFLGSSCIYPRLAEQPMKEEALLTGSLEPTNEPYAVAKIAGIKLCESYNRQYGTDYRSLMPTNLYGPGDNFHAEDSHVIPGLMVRIHQAKLSGDEAVVIWGSGNQKREFLHVDDLARACVHTLGLPKDQINAATSPMCSHINVGTGVDVTIRELAETLADVLGYEGRLEFDTSRPDGAPRKLLDVSKVRSLGWQSEISLADGLKSTYEWFQANTGSVRA